MSNQPDKHHLVALVEDEKLRRREKAALVALAEEIGKPAQEPTSIVEMTNLKLEARERVEDHRQMVEMLNSTNHRQRAIACIIDKMTYLELVEFADDIFNDLTSLDVASFPSHMARWARKARQ
jgi:hypothetical protein